MSSNKREIWGLYVEYVYKISNSDWFRYYDGIKSVDDLTAPISIREQLLALALIHPDFYPEGVATSKSDPRGDREFKIHSTLDTICNAEAYFGYTCPISQSISEITRDHIWPYSLEGPTRPDNGIWLCSYHNKLKGSDFHHLTEEYLGKFLWLRPLLKNIVILKRR